MILALTLKTAMVVTNVFDRFVKRPLKNWMVFLFLLNRVRNDDFYFW